MILIIDNYDSFTYNLYQYLAQIEEVVVYRNDKISIDEITYLSPEHIIVSPGPGYPKDAGISRKLINCFKSTIPILGVCLGHQCIASVFGANIIKAIRPVHGKTSKIYIRQKDIIFKNISSPFTATRYHSLVVEKDSLPDELMILAETDRGEIMALKHKYYPIYGVQFHPESILTKNGNILLSNFLKITKVFNKE